MNRAGCATGTISTLSTTLSNPSPSMPILVDQVERLLLFRVFFQGVRAARFLSSIHAPMLKALRVSIRELTNSENEPVQCYKVTRNP